VVERRRAAARAATAAGTALALAVLVAGCDTVGEFGDWAGGSISTTVALTELTIALGAIDGVEGADFSFDPGAGVKTAAVDVRMRADDADWPAAVAALGDRAGDERLASLPVTVVLHGDGLEISLLLSEAAEPGTVDGAADALAVRDALDVPLHAVLGGGSGNLFPDMTGIELASRLRDPSLRSLLDEILDEDLFVQGPGLLLTGSAPPEPVVELYAGMVELLPAGVCGPDCPDGIGETSDLSWGGAVFALGYLSQEHPLDAPSAEAVELVRRALAVEGVPGGFDYFFADPEAVGSFPSAHLEVGDCAGQRMAPEPAALEHYSAFRAGLAAQGLDIPAEPLGYCLPG